MQLLTEGQRSGTTITTSYDLTTAGGISLEVDSSATSYTLAADTAVYLRVQIGSFGATLSTAGSSEIRIETAIQSNVLGPETGFIVKRHLFTYSVPAADKGLTVTLDPIMLEDTNKIAWVKVFSTNANDTAVKCYVQVYAGDKVDVITVNGTTAVQPNVDVNGNLVIALRT